MNSAANGNRKNLLKAVLGFYGLCAGLLSHLQPLGVLGLRLVVARVFFLSGMTKWDGFSIRQDAYDLFAYEYFADYNLPEGLLRVMTAGAAIGEVALPIFLVAGLLGRFAALGLLVMTMVIQVFVYPEEWWAVHAWWAVTCLFIAVNGPGALSLDRLIGLERR